MHALIDKDFMSHTGLIKYFIINLVQIICNYKQTWITHLLGLEYIILCNILGIY